MKRKPWLIFALTTTVFWGIWGAYAGAPVANGFPETLIYCVWAITMIPPAVVALKLSDWKLDRDLKSVVLGCIVGLLGAGGQLVLFHAVSTGPAWLIFPIISLSPAVTIALSFALLKERTSWLGGLGIVLALCALPLFEYSRGEEAAVDGGLWFVLALIVLLAWGIQAYFIKLSNSSMRAESIFFYMTLTGLLLMPVALLMTDFSQPVNWGLDGVALAAIVQVLNAVGALFLVYAFRYGKAIVVSPLINAGAPLMTAIIALATLGVMPSAAKTLGIVCALVSACLLAIEPEETPDIAPNQEVEHG